MNRLDYVKPTCEVVELEREGYILCASYLQPTNDSQIEEMKPGSGWADFKAEFNADANRNF